MVFYDITARQTASYVEAGQLDKTWPTDTLSRDSLLCARWKCSGYAAHYTLRSTNLQSKRWIIWYTVQFSMLIIILYCILLHCMYLVYCFSGK